MFSENLALGLINRVTGSSGDGTIHIIFLEGIIRRCEIQLKILDCISALVPFVSIPRYNCYKSPTRSPFISPRLLIWKQS